MTSRAPPPNNLELNNCNKDSAESQGVKKKKLKCVAWSSSLVAWTYHDIYLRIGPNYV